MKGVMGMNKCPEYMAFTSHDEILTGTNWRWMCEKKVCLYQPHCDKDLQQIGNFLISQRNIR